METYNVKIEAMIVATSPRDAAEQMQSLINNNEISTYEIKDEITEKLTIITL